jgi:outer membrane protein
MNRALRNYPSNYVPRRSPLALAAALLALPLAAARAQTAAPAPAVSARAPAPILQLHDAENSAKQHQPSLLQARASTDAADARVGEARAPLLPQVTGSLGYQRTTGNYVPRAGAIPSASTTVSTSNSWTSYNAFSDSLVANQLIYDFNQTYGKYGAAKALLESTALTEQATQLLVVLNVRTAFFSARANRELSLVARQTVANDEKHLAQTEGFFQAGTKSEVDVAQTKSDLATAQLAQVTADNNYETAKQQLLLAMGVVGSTDFDVAEDSLPAVEGETREDWGALVDEAVKDRPEMAAYAAQIRAQEETISSARGGYGPALSATAGLTQGGEALDNLGWNAYVGVSLTWYLFQGGLTNSTVREAQANLRVLAAETEGQRQQIASDVNTARLAVRAGLESQTAAQVALVNAKELLRLAEGQYETGIGSIIQLSDAQVAESTAAAQVIQANFNLATARAQLLKALARP